MSVASIIGIAVSSLSAIAGKAKSGLSAISGLSIATATSVVVAGGGDTSIGGVNGTYAITSTVNGRAFYSLPPGSYTIGWSGTQWEFRITGTSLRYYNTDNVAYPQMCTSAWQITSGLSPAPTVS